jgi:hypothetical protein
MVKLEWYNTCKKELFDEHYRKWPELFQPYVDKPLEYLFNSAGFRMNFEMIPDRNKKVDLFLGCSHTYGAGQYWENTWPYLVSQYTGNEIVNLGMGGYGSESAYFNLIKYFEYFNVQNVFYFQDIVSRYDYFTKDGEVHQYSPQWTHTPDAIPYANWHIRGALVEDWYVDYNHTKNVNAMVGFLKGKDVPFYHLCEFPNDPTGYYKAMTTGHSPLEIADIDKNWYEENCKKVLVARDGAHSPALMLKIIADKFIKAIKTHEEEGFVQSTPYIAKIFQKISPSNVGE